MPTNSVVVQEKCGAIKTRNFACFTQRSYVYVVIIDLTIIFIIKFRQCVKDECARLFFDHPSKLWDGTVCFSHVTYPFQSQSTLYSCLNVKELWSLTDCNWTRTQNHLVRKRTLNHLTKLFKWFSVRLRTKCF